MNKKELIESVASSMGCTLSQAQDFVNAFQATMIESLMHDGELTLHGFGTFRRKTRKARRGRNPQTGLIVEIPEKQVIQFKASKNLLDAVNRG